MHLDRLAWYFYQFKSNRNRYSLFQTPARRRKNDTEHIPQRENEPSRGAENLRVKCLTRHPLNNQSIERKVFKLLTLVEATLAMLSLRLLFP
mmetsp:Transcript_6905/g.16854  ORF Transcript_6905/g.16854 Transcript_6905/m.16854 type:complete len:92 (-) Transcript_6905:3959-4234(-)